MAEAVRRAEGDLEREVRGERDEGVGEEEVEVEVEEDDDDTTNTGCVATPHRTISGPAPAADTTNAHLHREYALAGYIATALPSTGRKTVAMASTVYKNF